MLRIAMIPHCLRVVGRMIQSPVVSNAPKRDLNVMVVGGGIGGMAAALALRRAGHHAVILEASKEHKEVGAGLNLLPNATRILIRWGLKERLMPLAHIPKSIAFRRWRDFSIIGATSLDDVEQTFGAPIWQVHRADLLNALTCVALDKATVGPCPTLQLGAQVRHVGFSSGKAVAVLDDGRTFCGDIVIGADGIHSGIRSHVLGCVSPPVSTGHCAYRATVAISVLQAKFPSLHDAIEGNPCTLIYGPRMHIVFYPIKGGSLLNIVVFVPEDTSKETLECYSDEGDFETLPRYFRNWSRIVQELISLVGSWKRWPLLERAVLPSWLGLNGQLCLLGDAAHPILPDVGQGAAMAIEDAAVLGRLLQGQPIMSEVPNLLARYESLRKPRVTAVADTSRAIRYANHLPDGEDQLRRDTALSTAKTCADLPLLRSAHFDAEEL